MVRGGHGERIGSGRADIGDEEIGAGGPEEFGGMGCSGTFGEDLAVGVEGEKPPDATPGETFGIDNEHFAGRHKRHRQGPHRIRRMAIEMVRGNSVP